MNHKNIIFLLLILICIGCNEKKYYTFYRSHLLEEGTFSRFNLAQKMFYGKVKEVKEECFQLIEDSEGNLKITTNKYLKDGYYCGNRLLERINRKFVFDSLGRIVNYQYALGTGSIDGYRYEYNQKGLLSKVLRENSFNVEYYYNEDNLLIEEVSYEYNYNASNWIDISKSCYQYDSNGLLKDVKTYQRSLQENNTYGKLELSEHFNGNLIEVEIDKKGNIMKEVRRETYDRYLMGIYIYEYSNNGILNKKTWHNTSYKDWKFFDKREYYESGITRKWESMIPSYLGNSGEFGYLETGDIITVNGHPAAIYKDYDEKGNWTTAIYFYIDPKTGKPTVPNLGFKREYRYFPK